MKERIYKCDNLNFILIGLVVLGHFAEDFVDASWMFKRIWTIIYVFHMPVFVFVSGMFSKGAVADKAKLKKRVGFFLEMYVIYKVLLMLVKLIITKEASFVLFHEKGIPWYMLAMAIFLLITHLVKDVKPLHVFIMSIVVACALGYDHTLDDFMALARAATFYPFFLMGYYSKHDMELFQDKKNKKIYSAIILVVYIAVVWILVSKVYNYRPMLTGRNPFFVLGRPHLGIFVRLAYYIAVTVIGLAIINIVPNKKCIFSVLGEKTLQIYVIHGLIVYALRYFGWIEGIQENLPSIAWKAVVYMTALVTFVISCIPLEPFKKSIYSITDKCLKINK